ncbi:MAG: prealbumin-like fold domain-containing protein [Actinomycetota bacterium]
MLDSHPTTATLARDRRALRGATPVPRFRRRIQGLLLTGVLAASAVAPVFGGAPVAIAASASGVVNTYQAVSAVSGTTVTVTGATRGAATPFAVGDRVMLIQMTGVSPAQPGSNMGNYDTATITAVAGSSITLSAVTRTYSVGTEAVQLVRMEHDTAPTTVTGTITAAPWDGATGGVVAMSGGSLVLNSDIDASETGFTNDDPPTGTVVPSLSSGAGDTVGRGEPGGAPIVERYLTSNPGGPGGGLGGGGGTAGPELYGTGGGRGGGGTSDVTDPPAAGSDGGLAGGVKQYYEGADGGAGGGGGVLGGGGGGGSQGSGGGGGTDGGGAGSDMRQLFTIGDVELQGVGGGGGGPLGVGNGGDGLAGGPTGNATNNSANEGSAGGGGGSYGGGGGAPSNWSGGDDSSGGGGGGSWTGGGQGGTGGVYVDGNSYPAGGDGNAPVAAPLPDSAHYLNLANPRLMMGGAGGRGSQDAGHSDGGAGGGIVFLDFDTIGGAGDVRSDGGEGATPAGGGAHSGSGGGAGGQMRVRAHTIDNPLVFAANGGLGGTATANLYHAGVSGGGGGAGGIWVELLGAEPSCPADDVPNLMFELAGGNGGPSITNPKNNRPAGTGGAGGSGLGCVSPLQAPNLTFDKSSDPVPGTAVKPGDEITYAVTIENTGTVASVDGLVTDDMADVLDKATLVTPPVVVCEPVASSCGEVVFTSGDTEFIWQSTPADPLDVATTATVSYTVVIDEGATGTVGNLLVEPDVLVEHPIIEWSKANDAGDDVLVAPGDTVVYTISVTNTGSVDSEEFAAVDDLSDVVDDATFDEDSIVIDPAGLGTAVYDPAEQTLTWTGALEAEQTVEVSYAVTVDEGAVGELRNAFFDTTVVNPIAAALQWNKVDDTAEANLLAGAEWELTPLDDEGDPAGEVIVIVDCVEAPCTGVDTDPEPGQFLLTGLAPGDYELVETKAPFGFVLDPTPIVVTVLDTAAVTVLDDVVNTQQSAPTLPFTGGLGAEHLMILGGALLALMTGLGAWQVIRRRAA